jgi:ApeA N-terminal domain 1
MHNVMLSNDYTFYGMWWLPTETEGRYGGRLELSPARMTLTILGDDPDILALPYGQHATIHGTGTDGTQFTLLGVVPGGGRGSSASVHANLCLVGMHVANAEEPIIANAYFNFTHLEDWFAQQIFSEEMHFGDDDEHFMTASCKTLGKLIDCCIPSHSVHVSSHHGVGRRSNWFTDLHWSCRAYVNVTHESGYRPREIRELATQLSRLWTILSGVWCQEQLAGLVSPTDGRLYQLYYMTSSYRDNDDRAIWRDIVFPFEEAQNDICGVMRAWWQRSEAFDATSLLYHKVAMKHHMAQYNILDIVDLVHAMDILSSIRGKTNILDDSRQMLKAAKAVIKEQKLAPDIGKQFLEKLSHCNERSLGRKILSSPMAYVPRRGMHSTF